jgi:hypothetical protein
MNFKRLIPLLSVALMLTLLYACGSNGGSTVNASNGLWTWVGGSNSINQAGSYGAIGISAASNAPPARDTAASWNDSNGNLWLYGGHYFDSTSQQIFFNDLWKFDGTNWTWIKGSSTGNQTGIYGTKGIPASTNGPGSRYGATSWTDTHDQLWLFGGVDSSGVHQLNDLWKFDGSNWVWVSGPSAVDQAGSYGMKGTPASSNMPGARAFAANWIDKNGHLWLWGGLGKDSAGQLGGLRLGSDQVNHRE